MISGRVRLSTVLVSIASLAMLLAFWRLKPRQTFIEIVPFELLAFLLAIILITFTLMVVLAFRRK
jgi:hypothetical protein